MRKTIIKSLVLATVAVAMSSCDENAWNDKLDGFEVEPITDVKTINYTLTDADYAAIASNATNKALAEAEGQADALKALATTHCFSQAIPASKYAPAFLASTNFGYFTLSNGSYVKLTYNVADPAAEIVAQLAAADKLTLSTDEYMLVWGSDDNFINGFAPSKKPAKYIPGFLGDIFDDAEAGQYVIVTYQQTEQEPIFGNVGGGEEPSGSYTHVKAKSITSGKKYVMVADGNAATTVDEAKGYGYLGKTEVDEDGQGLELTDEQSACAFTLVATDGGYNIVDVYGRYLYQTGTYNSFNFAAECPAEGAVWTVEAQGDGTMKITNTAVEKFIQYDPNYGSYGSYADARGVLPALYEEVAASAKAPVVEVPFTTVISAWGFNGSSWSSPANVVVLQPADYTAMGQTYQNLSNNAPAELLPIFLKNKFPYAVADDTKYVLYQYYANSATNYVCDQYVYNGTEWAKFAGVAEETSQFVRNNGVWNFDPSVVITLPAGRSQEPSITYYQACVDWVYENIDVPLGSTSIKSGQFYISSYGNNEYYSGTSAYQNDVDLRAAAARTQYPAGFEGMSDEQIVELMKYRFAYEVMPGALKMLHPDAVPVDGIEVIYTINFVTYNGANSNETIRYQVTAPAEFTFIDCTWWEGGKPAE